ncbi:MAG TPA: lipoyl(octanoyl) transferase LipB [Arenimonas sp.]|uniref:lipoyl(octanoyl) transferase LipB n=1 Tax=Arenimonas sp. TaxID=1872635 RepID=UPI002CA71DE4|nr:lipoyl(octanoyl) transferase LipB [Arenimonas sp.]HMB57250.1 lipoyl(octanoyl) transferase LipB [Arenimonas sp.]
MSGAQPVWTVRDLGRQPFERVWRAMETYTDSRGDDGADELWLVEHDPVFTLGQAGKPEHVLAPGDIPVLRTNRGGQVTYHGPGQLVAYPLVDLRRIGIGVREFVQRIEQALIDTLATWDIPALRREGAPGVYVQGEKIGALGLRVRHGCTFHGLAFNIAMDLEPFSRINPCGYAGLQVTSVLKSGGPATLPEVASVLVSQLSKQLGLRPETSTEPPLLLQAALLPA